MLLLETECVWDHIRFFFAYGHYRHKLNFTFKNYNKACKLLKIFRKMLVSLKIAENSKQKSNTKAKELVKRLKIDFEKYMNDDLQVKIAFDCLFKTVSNLVKLKEKKMLNFRDSKKALEQLKAIDHVFQVFF